MLEAALGCFAAVVAVAAAARASRRASRPLCSDLPSLTLVKPPTHNRRPPSQLDDLVLGETRACPEWERLLSLRCFSLHLLRHGNALFLQTPEGVDVYSSFSGSFVKDAQLRNAVSVLSVPMEMMMRWAEGLGVACDSLLLTSTGRCGSTLLAQLLESQPGVISISEPMALGVSAAMLASPRAVRSPDFLGEWIKQEATSVAAAALAAQLKDFKRGQLVCIKLHSQGTVVAPLLAKAFPEMRQLYLYRNAEETVTSFNRFAMALLPGFIVRLKASFVGRLVFYKGILPLHLTYKTMPFFISNLMDEEVSWARSVWVWAQVCRVRALAGVFTLARQKDAMSIVVSMSPSFASSLQIMPPHSKLCLLSPSCTSSLCKCRQKSVIGYHVSTSVCLSEGLDVFSRHSVILCPTLLIDDPSAIMSAGLQVLSNKFQ